MKLLLAEGLSAQDVTVDLELPEQYLLGAEPAVYAVYTLNGGAKQESTSVRVKAEITGLAELLEQSGRQKAGYCQGRGAGQQRMAAGGHLGGVHHRRSRGHGAGAAAARPPEKAPQNGKAP